MKNFILTKLLSKKFIGWVGATVLLCVGRISDDTWLWVTLTYMGTETALNILEKIKGRGNSNEQA